MPHWIIHKDGGPRRVNHAAAVVGNRIFSFGGYCTGGDYKSRRPIDVFIFNTCKLYIVQGDFIIEMGVIIQGSRFPNSFIDKNRKI